MRETGICVHEHCSVRREKQHTLHYKNMLAGLGASGPAWALPTPHPTPLSKLMPPAPNEIFRFTVSRGTRQVSEALQACGCGWGDRNPESHQKGQEPPQRSTDRGAWEEPVGSRCYIMIVQNPEARALHGDAVVSWPLGALVISSSEDRAFSHRLRGSASCITVPSRPCIYTVLGNSTGHVPRMHLLS